jgi:hypothetical protein
LSWKKFESHKPGAITLGTPGERRLLKYLLKQNSAKVAEANESLFSGLIDAWNGSDDPATELEQGPSTDAAGIWRLEKLETSGFGGLTVFGGPMFECYLEGENWCLEGQNGSGKTSFASAILWTLSGRRIREQDGLIEDEGRRAPVYNEKGEEIGTWPPLVSYPAKAHELIKAAEVWVRLTFKNEKGDSAIAFRKIISPADAEPQVEIQIDPRLLTVPQLIETGLLMPARIPRIGFGDRSQSLYEAVKMLTGLDQLADIADGVGRFTSKAQRFYKYAKDQGIDRLKTKFDENLARADAKAMALKIDTSKLKTLGQKDLSKSLRDAAKDASTQASEHLATLKSEIAPGLDTAQADVRAKVKVAVAAARTILNQGARGITEFDAWTALKIAAADEQFKTIPDSVAAAKISVKIALEWHQKQIEDQKLRLKALAAQYYVIPNAAEVPQCPVCEGDLTSEKQKALAAELADLKKNADVAERKIDDVCATLEKGLRGLLSADLRKHYDFLKGMVPKNAYETAAVTRFAQNESFSSTLTGIVALTKELVTEQAAKLPVFVFTELSADGLDTPATAIELQKTIYEFERLVALVTWWSQHAHVFYESWSTLVGKQDAAGNVPTRTIAGELAKLEQAVEKAEPLDEFATSLLAAADAVDEWEKIQEHQKVREAIIEALEPLKDLRLLVGAETARSISNLSGRIKAILGRIHLQERLAYENASLGKKAIQVEGSFEPGIQIDAALVANTSWLRAILWAFVLALREQTIEGLSTNPFPLVVLDDPQTTFDPRNKRKWAEELAASANADRLDKNATQLVITTHEQQFFQFLVNEQKLVGQQGLIAPANKACPVATIVNGGRLDRAYTEAVTKNDDALGHRYVSDVRIYCEDLLKCIFRAEGPKIADMNLESLRKEFERLRNGHVAPFNREPFTKLFDVLSGGGGKPMNLINASHHQFDGTIGVAEAKDVKQFWDSKLRRVIETAFHAYAHFQAFSGDPRIFIWEENVVEFPPSQSSEIKKLKLLNTGVAAAAKTDGRAGDGALSIKEWESATPISLHNHEVYQLAAGTLDPVAAIGDLIIVSNYAKVTKHSIVVAIFGERLLARRYSETDLHPDIAILTGQTVEPHDLPQPVIIPREKAVTRKIVGTIFTSQSMASPPKVADREIVALLDLSVVRKALDGSRLFEVQGRSAEPIALDTQYLITHPVTFDKENIQRLEGRLVVAVDENGARYFKRLRSHGTIAVLESLNPDGTTPAELLSFDGSLPFPKLTDLLEVMGILFELPDGPKEKP